MIFVFGSNEAGRHGSGAAKDALKYGAEYGKGFGHVGNTYAIPTKDGNLKTLPLSAIERYVGYFLGYARTCPELRFKVTRIGCGLAGYKDEEIAPLFKGAPKNCYFDQSWGPYLEDSVEYWGKFDE